MADMDNQLKLNDIADELLIVNKITIDKLFNLENCTDCIALYLFYYKTAKWQKTNTIKANDAYIKKSLKWGTDRIRKTKQTLKENGLIDIVQRRENGKITGWFVEVSYLVSQKKTEDIKIKVEESNNTQKQQVAKPRSGEEETNALKEKIKCLEKEIEILKNNNNINNNKKSNKDNIYTEEFETLWKLYPRKVGKPKALKSYQKARKNGTTYEEVQQGINAYCKQIEAKKTEVEYIKHGSTWFNGQCWLDEYETKAEILKSNLPFDESKYTL